MSPTMRLGSTGKPTEAHKTTLPVTNLFSSMGQKTGERRRNRGYCLVTAYDRIQIQATPSATGLANCRCSAVSAWPQSNGRCRHGIDGAAGVKRTLNVLDTDPPDQAGDILSSAWLLGQVYAHVSVLRLGLESEDSDSSVADRPPARRQQAILYPANVGRGRSFLPLLYREFNTIAFRQTAETLLRSDGRVMHEDIVA